MRIARRSADPFLRLLTATATMWVLGQVFINVGYVIGLLPVTGLQLPLISAGGTSTATTLLIIGVIANAARHEPEAVAALRAGRDDRVNRLLRLPLPEPYSPTRTEALRDRLRSRSDKPAAKAPRKPAKDNRRKPHAADRPGATLRASWRRPTRVSARTGTTPPGPTGSHTGRSTLRVNGPISVVLAGGGTAGHVEPAMAVADALSALDPGVRITALGTQRGLETRLVPERGYDLELITPVPLPRKPTGDLLRLPLRVRRAVQQTRTVLDDVDADVVIGFGGYVALPAYLAARGGALRRRRVPVVIHEANASAGWANRVGARSARRVLSAVPESGAAAAPRSSACRCARRSPRLTGWRCGRRPAPTSDSPTTRRCCWCSAARRARSRSTEPSRPPPKTLPQRCLGAARARAEERAGAARARRR